MNAVKIWKDPFVQAPLHQKQGHHATPVRFALL